MESLQDNAKKEALTKNINVMKLAMEKQLMAKAMEADKEKALEDQQA